MINFEVTWRKARLQRKVDFYIGGIYHAMQEGWQLALWCVRFKVTGGN